MILTVLISALMFWTHPIDGRVQTLRTVTDNDFLQLPWIDQEGNRRIEISFDMLENEEEDIRYRVVHCDRNWEATDISELDYADGFMPVTVNDRRPSWNTFVNYWHYSVTFPNDDIRLLLSGNYAVIFHTEDDPDTLLAVATFSVTEQSAFVNGTVSPNTDIDYLAFHQQLTLNLSWSREQLPWLDPGSEVTLAVTQNRQARTRRLITAPSRMDASHAWYEHLRPLIFEAGNNWRRFEFTDKKYVTIGVESVGYHAPYYYARLITDEARAAGHYIYDRDQEGRFLIAARGTDDADVEADYFYAQWTLDIPQTLTPVYLTGDFLYGNLSDDTRMRWDADEGVYHCEKLLKQGAYNYQYVTSPDGAHLTFAQIEGNYYEAQNEYEVYVYYRPTGGRYDRLLSVATFK